MTLELWGPHARRMCEKEKKMGMNKNEENVQSDGFGGEAA